MGANKEVGRISEIDGDWEESRVSKVEALRVDLACGARKKKGFLGVDICKCEGVDVVHDLSVTPWPFESGSIGELRASHYIEHVRDIKTFMEEAWRVMAKNAIFEIQAPYYTSMRAFQDFTHVREISEATFLYFSRKWMKANKLEHYAGNYDFEIASTGFIWEDEWKAKSDLAREFARKHYTNVIRDILVTLRKV